jgi:hypothetical protein
MKTPAFPMMFFSFGRSFLRASLDGFQHECSLLHLI